ncbi:pumilio, putative [Entamoeba dispar SAW760]|uniref:Pumilio, putative n=1 Tax=Entamoeba dispar (strain ATCC PRA-260 / SAW760) TaxID=370354 RepID=B0EQ63_ENTDS|nr:pumilio, putative [Entamoeba dispar SAW760]EDR23351.1 pumilio, putative [Entamoeba dispar SAW760]|eukprot:EDR23351.1 pumilio, putative [Entamoeba dispar SAW760]
MTNTSKDIVQQLLFNESRSTSAPPQMDRIGSSGEVISLEDLEKQAYRAHPEYHQYYFQQKPADPRLPKPLFAWNLPKGYETVLKKAFKTTPFNLDKILEGLSGPNLRNELGVENEESYEEEDDESEEDSEEDNTNESSEEGDDSDEDNEDTEESSEEGEEDSESYEEEESQMNRYSRYQQPYQPNYQYNGNNYPINFGYIYPINENVALDYVSMSKEHNGSRTVQQSIEKGSEDERQKIWRALQDHIVELSSDLFANYVIQKALEFIPESRHIVPQKMKGNVLRLTLHMYGCRVVQKAVEYVSMKDRRLLFEELRKSLVRCIEDQNGNHVIQKCVEKGDRQMVMDIVNALQGIVLECCKHPYGCRVVQRVIESVDYDCVTELLQVIEPHSLDLTEDQYGNYVVQNVLERGYPNDRHNILQQIKGNIVRLSMGKYSSNVIEKCFKFATPNERQQILEEIYQNNGILQMMQDQFANYVVQKIIEAIDSLEREKIVELFIKPNLSILKKVTYTKHILNLLETLDDTHL